MNRLYLLVLCLYAGLIACHKNDTKPVPEHFNDGLNDGINYGIAAPYKNDVGLSNNKYVLAVEDFESGTTTLSTEHDRYKTNIAVVSNQGFNSDYAALHSWKEGHNGPTCRYLIPEEAQHEDRPAYFVRMYLKFDKSFHPHFNSTPPEGNYSSVGVKGFGIYNESGSSGVNVPCDGTNWYGVACQFVGWGPSAKKVANDKFLWFGHMYSYNAYPLQTHATKGEIKISDPGKGEHAYRFSIYGAPYQYITFDEWDCYEIGLYLNTPGLHDGEARFWINGVLQSRASNMRFRDIEDLKPLSVHLNLHRTTEKFKHTMKRYADNIVIAKRYIGPIKKNP